MIWHAVALRHPNTRFIQNALWNYLFGVKPTEHILKNNKINYQLYILVFSLQDLKFKKRKLFPYDLP